MLAALASAAVRGLDPVRTATPPSGGSDFDVAVVEDDRGQRWVVRAPRQPVARAALEAEMRLLAGLRRRVPFAVPAVSGTARLPEGGRCVVYPHLPGAPVHPHELEPGPGAAVAVGRALAALHDVPAEVLEEAGLPVYDAEEYRLRRMVELDRAAATGQVPARLLTRWEQALEDVGSWRFSATPVHGDLVADHVLVLDGEVSGVTDWGDAKVADPADDLAWLVSGASEDALDTVLEAYGHARREPPDPGLVQRARLAGELALARWLLHGVSLDDPDIVGDAVEMLADLERHVEDEPL